MMNSQAMGVPYEASDPPGAGAARRPLGSCWALLGVALAGLGMTIYLTLSALGRGTIAGCGAGSACDMAMTSVWAWWLGVPISALAAGVYGGILVATIVAMRGSRRALQWAWTLMPALAIMLVGAAVWFIYVLLFRIGMICPWCTINHMVGLAAAGLIVLGAATARDSASGKRLIGAARWSLAAATAAAGLSALIGGQILRPTPTYTLVDASSIGAKADDGHGHATGDGDELLSPTGDFYREVDGRRMIAPAFTDIVLDPYELPMIGSPDAQHLLVFFFDYTCGACRQAHSLLRHARQRLGDQIGVVLVTFPNSSRCNAVIAERTVIEGIGACEFARLGLALWRASPQVFDQFEGWMLGFQTAPPLDVGVKQAIDLAGRERLEAALADPWVEQQLQQYVQFSRPVMEHFRGTPIILMGHKFMPGIPDNPEAFCRILEEQLGVTRQAAQIGP